MKELKPPHLPCYYFKSNLIVHTSFLWLSITIKSLGKCFGNTNFKTPSNTITRSSIKHYLYLWYWKVNTNETIFLCVPCLSRPFPIAKFYLFFRLESKHNNKMLINICILNSLWNVFFVSTLVQFFI